MGDAVTLVLGSLVALQTLQTIQVAILRRDVRNSLRPPPPRPRRVVDNVFNDGEEKTTPGRHR